MQYLIYLVFRGGISVFMIIPFRLIFIISDFLYYIVYYLLKYRRKVVKDNLFNSFPEKNSKEIKVIEKKFYRYFCDIVLESVKGMTMNKAQIIKRHRIINPEWANEYLDKGKSILALTAHYGNWEWGSFSGSLQIKYPIFAFYKPISNRFIDQYIRKSRTKFNTTLLSIKGTYDSFVKHKDTVAAYIMVADQNPSNDKDCYWIDFLHRETACLHGPEKYARLYHFPVLYIDIQRKKRGFYELNLTTIIEDPSSVPNGKITELYFKTLEKIIIEKPEYWLWTHRRWKYEREVKN